MGRRCTKWAAELGLTPAEVSACFPPLRQHWRQINREERAAQAELRANRKARDKKRAKCRCDAYKFPHRPGGGLCRNPDPPATRWQDAEAAEIAERVAKFKDRHGEPTAEQMADLIALTSKPSRPFRNRYAGLIRQIARASGLHPIQHRSLIQQLMPHVVSRAKAMKRQTPRLKYRNIKVTEANVTDEKTTYSLRGEWTTAGPTM